MKKIAGFTFLTVFCVLLSGCATRMTVLAGLSDNIKEYYSIYPSVEIDIAAVTEEEADELKKVNADNYFLVGNAMRESLSPYTFMFSAEQTAPQTMKYNVSQWDKWLEKDPKKIAVVANIPSKTDENSKGKDPRVLILEMSTGFMHHKKIYVEAKPGGVVRISKEPTDPEVKRKENEKMKKKESSAQKQKEAKKKAAEEKKAAKKKAAEEKRAAKKKAAEEKKAARKKAAEERKASKKASGKKTAAQKKAAETEASDQPKENAYKKLTSRKKG